MSTILTDGRACSAQTIIGQVGRSTMWAISNGEPKPLSNYDDEWEENYEYGVVIPLAGSRSIVIVLDFSDLYTVYRVRKINKGERAGEEVVEAEKRDIFCDQLSEVVYDLGSFVPGVD